MYRAFLSIAVIVLYLIALSMGKTIEKGGVQARSASRRQLGDFLPPSSCSSDYECDYPQICHPNFGFCYAIQDRSLNKRSGPGGMLPPTSCSSDYECEGYQEICHPKYGFCYYRE